MNYNQFEDENISQEYNNQLDIQNQKDLVKQPINNTDTVAIIMLKNGQIPPQDYGMPLRQLFYRQQLPIPRNWNDEQNMSIFDQACFGEIPNINGHKPDEQDEDGFTVAMILAINNINIPQCWYYDSQIRNKYGQTVEIIQAQRRLFVQQQWIYMKQKNKQQQWYSTSYVLSLEGIISYQFQYNNTLNYKERNIILQQLSKKDIIIINNQEYFNVKCYRNFTYCDLCNDNQCNYFIMNNHNHNICAICYACILEQKQTKQFDNQCKVETCNINVKFHFKKLINANQQDKWYELYDYINSYDKIPVIYKNKRKRQLLYTNETEFNQSNNQLWLPIFD